MHIHAVPMPGVTVSASQSLILSGSRLSLNCSIQPSVVDTPTLLTFNWTVPNSTHNITYTLSNTSTELMIYSVETTDSGDYICSARMTDASDSSYVLDSEIAIDVVNINVCK